MANDVKQLTKLWIEFLKHNQIVDANSDPKTGDLRYRKPVLPGNLDIFLRINTEFEDADINNAIKMVLAKKMTTGIKSLPSGNNRAQPSGRSPGSPGPTEPEVVGNPTVKPRQKKPRYSKDDAEDTAFKDKQQQARLKEAIKDTQHPETLDEKDVEDVFTMLVNKASQAPDASEIDKTEKFKKIKKLIRDGMTAKHRKALWRALTND